MPESDDRRERLSRLWLDVLVEDEPDSDLLTRYAEDPDALGPEERASIEARLGEPRVADRLRVLEGFDAALAATGEEPPPVGAELRRGAAPARARSWRSWLTVGPLALAGAAAAALTIAILLPEGSGPPPPRGDTLARAPQRPAAPGPAPAVEPAPPVPERAPAEPTVRPRSAMPGIDPSLVAELAPPHEPESEARAAAAGRVFTARAEPERATQAADELFEGEIEGAPMRVASAIDYATPPELIERPWARTYRSLAPPGAGSTGDGPQLRALVPEHVAFTSSAAPPLFWYLAGKPVPGWRFLLELAPSERPDQAGEAELPAPGAPGVQRVNLADLGVVLEPGVEYVWTITAQPDASDPSRDVSAQGWIKRVELARTTREQLGDRPLSNGLVYAEAGLWYDALGAVADAIALRPDLAAGREAYRRLLAGAGLTQYATQLPQP